MSRHFRQKLNHLPAVLPEGLPVDASWLQKHGYSRKLAWKYAQSGWLQSPAHSVYRRPSTLFDQNTWEPVVVSLQKLLELPITIGGRTALELQGYSHYLYMGGPAEVHLYGPASAWKSWVAKLVPHQEFHYHSKALFNSAFLAGKAQTVHFTELPWANFQWSLLASTAERAILELLDELPTRESFDQVDQLFEGLTNLRPTYLDQLLSECKSIKVKRLFMWFASRHNHAWFGQVNAEAVDLGSGKRMVVRGGKLDSRYLITVPDELAKEQ
jgi:hypothetical protein